MPPTQYRRYDGKNYNGGIERRTSRRKSKGSIIEETQKTLYKLKVKAEGKCRSQSCIYRRNKACCKCKQVQLGMEKKQYKEPQKDL